MAERLRIGVIGAGYVAGRALLPAIAASQRAIAVAVASRDPTRAAALARQHGAVAHRSYDALLDDRGIDAVYVALHNAAHREWTLRALDAGKHVLCEKPLGVDAADVAAMADGARRSGRVLMEAFMYRFHPRMRRLRQSVDGARFLSATFGFTLRATGNYRAQPELGGGALLDVGCYTLDVARWFLGEPEAVQAVMHHDGIDWTVAAALRFPGGSTAVTWASFETPEVQELVVADDAGVHHVAQPFTSWRDPDDPYQLMVDAFAASIIDGTPPPRTLDDSLRTARLLDQVRAAAAADTIDSAVRAAATR